jgi:chemotaxis protein MotB
VKNEPIIIIKKKAHGKHGHHGGAWKVAYADFVTAMMAFFLVMWIVAQSASTRAAVASYFRDPGVFETTAGQGLLNGAASGINTLENVAPADQARAVLEAAAKELRKTLESNPEFAALLDNVEIHVTADGLRIELLETEKDGFFQVGSSGLKTESIKLLGAIAVQMGKLPNKIAVEGHTDSRPYHSDDAFSNWELSSDRANAARREMQRLGLAPGQIEAVRGYADTKLRFKGSPLDARNRRVSILVRRIDAPATETATGEAPAAAPAAPASAPPAAAPAPAHPAGH